MWHTTEIFVSKGLEIPQFFGKVRVLANFGAGLFKCLSTEVFAADVIQVKDIKKEL